MAIPDGQWMRAFLDYDPWGVPNMDDLIAKTDGPFEENAALMPGKIHRASIRQQYEAEIADLERRIAKRKKMLELLAENPAIEQFIDLQRS